MKRFLKILLALFIYPQKVADAVNSAKDPQEMERMLCGEEVSDA